MQRSVILSFPHPQGLRDEDCDTLRCFVAAIPGAQADILIGRGRRGVAILTLNGRHVWISRNDIGVDAREAATGQRLAQDACLSALLATVRAALLPCDLVVHSGGPVVSASVPYGTM